MKHFAGSQALGGKRKEVGRGKDIRPGSLEVSLETALRIRDSVVS